MYLHSLKNIDSNNPLFLILILTKMKVKHFFASCAKPLFALAAVTMMSGLFTGCSKDEGHVPIIAPEQSVVINGQSEEIDNVRLVKNEEDANTYTLYLDFSDGKYLYFKVDPSEGKQTIDMSKVADALWLMGYNNEDGEIAFLVGGDDGDNKCDRGTLKYSVDPATGECSIEIADAHVAGEANTDGNGKEYAFATQWSGKAEKVNPLRQSVTIDGKRKVIKSAQLSKYLYDRYSHFLYLYLSDDKKEYLRIDVDVAKGNKKVFDMTRTGDITWFTGYHKPDGKYAFSAGYYSTSQKCDRGTITYNVDAKTGQASVEVTDAHITAAANKDDDKKEHTYAVKWSGKAQIVNYCEQQAMVDGTTWSIKSAELEKSKNDASTYILNLYLSDDKSDCLRFNVNPATGNNHTFDMSTASSTYWAVGYRKGSSDAFAVSNASGAPKCVRGTLTYNVDPKTGQCSVDITDAYITAAANTAGDRKEYVFGAKWSGKAKIIANLNQELLIDGETRTVRYAELYKDRDDMYTYILWLYLSGGSNESMRIDIDVNSGNNEALNMSQSSSTVWGVLYRTTSNIFEVGSRSGKAKCERGTITYNLDPATGQVSFEIADAHIAAATNYAGDHRDHDLFAKWSGKATIKNSASDGIWINGERKGIDRAILTGFEPNRFQLEFYNDPSMLNSIRFEVNPIVGNGRTYDLTRTFSDLTRFEYYKNVNQMFAFYNSGQLGRWDRGTLSYNINLATGQYNVDVTNAHISAAANKVERKEYIFQMKKTGTAMMTVSPYANNLALVDGQWRYIHHVKVYRSQRTDVVTIHLYFDTGETEQLRLDVKESSFNIKHDMTQQSSDSWGLAYVKNGVGVFQVNNLPTFLKADRGTMYFDINFGNPKSECYFNVDLGYIRDNAGSYVNYDGRSHTFALIYKGSADTFMR